MVKKNICIILMLIKAHIHMFYLFYSYSLYLGCCIYYLIPVELQVDEYVFILCDPFRGHAICKGLRVFQYKTEIPDLRIYRFSCNYNTCRMALDKLYCEELQ